jgi:protein-S-isoprenylcysteine O-methyltransferase Ste14
LKWQVIPDVIWNVENRTLRAILDTLFWVGWLIVLASTFMINHFDLFGLRQVYLRLRNLDYTHLAFQTKWLYRFVRHPLMLGFIIVFWVTPIMTLGHLFFSLATTAYIFIGVYLEERDLITYLGQEYIQYQKDVPMLFPIPSRKSVPVSRDTGTE